MIEEEVTTTPQPNSEIESMFKAGIHFAYKKTRRHPKMREFIAGVRSNVEVFHLERTYEKLNIAISFLEKLGADNKMVLWIGTKPSAAPMIAKIGQEFAHPYVSRRWLGGTLTNFKVIRGRVDHLEKLEEAERSGELEKYTKQERLKVLEEIEKLKLLFGSLRLLKGMPDVVVIVDPKEEHAATAESMKIGAKVIAIMNSDCDPTLIHYPIPANDNAPKSVEYLLQKLSAAYKKGKANSTSEPEKQEEPKEPETVSGSES